MKNLISLLVLLFTINSFSQTMTEKWNSLYERFEYFNSNGTMVGYKKYNSLYNRWDYYDLKTTNTSRSSVDLELVDNVLSSKQAKYDANLLKIKETINQCEIYIATLYKNNGGTWETYLNARNRFHDYYVSKVGKYDLSNKLTFQQVDKFLYDGVIKIGCDYFKHCK